MADLRRIRQLVQDYYGNQPHPHAPDLTVNEYPAYQRVAAMLNSSQLRGNNPDPSMVTHAFHTLKNAQLSPGEFEHAWTVARPSANRLLNRDPSIIELTHHKGKSPAEIHGYYAEHPYPGYEEVTAGAMLRHFRAAEPIARRFGRKPNAEEVSRFAVANYSSEDMHNHYSEAADAR